MEEKFRELWFIAMRMHIAIKSAPGDGHKIPESLMALNRELEKALQVFDAASRHEVQV